MEQLSTYVQQARQQGQADEQIRQSLLTSGWNTEQVNAALTGAATTTSPVSQPTAYQSPASAMPAANIGQAFTTDSQPVVPKRKSKLPLVLVSVIALLLIVGGGAFALLGSKTSYQTVIQQFIIAIQRKDKATADSLESPAMLNTFGQKNAGKYSFYDTCQLARQLCTPVFTPAFFDKAIKTYKDYTADNGTKGKEVVYTLKQTASGSQAGGPGCKSNSPNTLTIAVVPKGNSWQIDIAEPNINDSADPSCLAPAGTSSTGTN